MSDRQPTTSGPRIVDCSNAKLDAPGGGVDPNANPPCAECSAEASLLDILVGPQWRESNRRMAEKWRREEQA